jgi:hypothetical protein
MISSFFRYNSILLFLISFYSNIFSIRPATPEMWLYRQSVSTGLFYVDPIFKYNDGSWETRDITVGAVESHEQSYRTGVILVDQVGAKALRQKQDELEHLPANSRRISTEIIITRK